MEGLGDLVILELATMVDFYFGRANCLKEGGGLFKAPPKSGRLRQQSGRLGSRFGRPGGRLPLLGGRFLSRLSRAGGRATCCGLTLENPRFWAEKWPEKPQIGGEINGIWPWERKGSKINKFGWRDWEI